VTGLKDEKLILKSKPTRKLKHTNSILEYFEYLCQMSSKSLLIILSYTVSKLTRFFVTQCRLYAYFGTSSVIFIFRSSAYDIMANKMQNEVSCPKLRKCISVKVLYKIQ